jgi:hypothetical protein
MKSSWFDNFRWGEIVSGLLGLSGFLSALVMAPIPADWKAWAQVGVAIIAFIVAFIRNPKSIPWAEGKEAERSIRKAVDIRQDRDDEV